MPRSGPTRPVSGPRPSRGPLLIRTLSLRAVLMIATVLAARLGDVPVAAHQIILSLWSLMAFALDAIAIAGQAIIGRYLGAGNTEGARAVCRRMVWWGVVSGAVLGALLAAARPLFIPVFTGTTPYGRRCCPHCWWWRSPSRSPGSSSSWTES